jgi:hypothetical protein
VREGFRETALIRPSRATFSRTRDKGKQEIASAIKATQAGMSTDGKSDRRSPLAPVEKYL